MVLLKGALLFGYFVLLAYPLLFLNLFTLLSVYNVNSLVTLLCCYVLCTNVFDCMRIKDIIIIVVDV